MFYITGTKRKKYFKGGGGSYLAYYSAELNTTIKKFDRTDT
jgi:hypothetical protein